MSRALAGKLFSQVTLCNSWSIKATTFMRRAWLPVASLSGKNTRPLAVLNSTKALCLPTMRSRITPSKDRAA